VPLADTLGPRSTVLGFGADPAGHLTGAQRDYLTRLGASLIKVTDSRPGTGGRAAVLAQSIRNAGLAAGRQPNTRRWISRR